MAHTEASYTFDFPRIRRRACEPQRFELTDPEAEGQRMVVWLRPIDELMEEAVKTRAAELVSMYVTGGFYHDTGVWQESPMSWPPIDDQPVEISESFCRLAARFEKMRSPGRPGAALTFDELVNMVTLTPTAWRQLQTSAAKVQREYDLGKPKAGTGNPSAPSNEPPQS